MAIAVVRRGGSAAAAGFLVGRQSPLAGDSALSGRPLHQLMLRISDDSPLG